MNKSLKAPTIPSAVQWAKFFMANKQEHNWTIDSINENLLIGYFANFWACAVDPLNTRIDEMQATIKRQQAALNAVDKLRRKYINRTLDKGNLETCIVVTDLKEALALAKADGGDL